MKKILLVLNGEVYNTHLTSFAIRLSKQTGAALKAVFVSPFVEQINTYPFPGELPMVAGGISGAMEMQQQHQTLVQANMDLFISDCKKTGIQCNITNDNDITVNELIDNSAFSDLILCDAKEQYGTYSFKDFIADIHCPVILVAEKARLP
jgi:hypothetical protein